MALIPPAVVVLMARRAADAGTRRAFRLFALLVAVWLFPCWVTLSSNAPFDYLTGEPPWESLRPEGTLDRNFLLNDSVLQFVPLREAARRSIALGELPFLDRFAGGGTPLWENMQLALLYPVNLLALPFSSFAWPLFASSAKLLLAACGTYLFLRRLGASHAGSMIGSIAYAFCAFNVAFLLFPHTNVTALLPLQLLAIGALVERRTPATILGAIIVTWSLITAGHPESVLHVAIVAVPYALLEVRRAERPARALGALSAAAVIAVLLAAPLLLPFANWLPHSERMAAISSSESFLRGPRFETASFAPFLIPNYFGNPRVHNYRHPVNFNELCTQYAGLATLILAAVAVRRKHALWVALFAVALLLAIMPEPVAAAVQQVPLLNITANARMRFVLAFTMAVLAGFGFDAAAEAAGRRRATVAAVVAGAAVVALALLSYPVFAQFGIRRLVFFTELAALASAAAIAIGARHLLPLLLFADLASVMALYNPATPREVYYPRVTAIARMQEGKPPFRVAGVGLSLIPNSATVFGLEDVRPHDPLAFGPYVEFLERNGFDRSDYFGRFLSPPPETLLRTLGVRYLLQGTEVTEVPDAAPRYPGELLRYGPNGATLRLTGPVRVQTGELALPGWRLERDGKPWPRDEGGVFLSWTAPAGTSTFRMRYVPVGLHAGLLLALAGIVATAVWVGVSRAPSVPLTSTR